MQNDLKNLSKKLEMFKVDNDRYPTTTAAGLTSLEVSIFQGLYITESPHPYSLVPCTIGSGQDYTVAAVSKFGEKCYIFSSTGSNVQEYAGTNAWSTYSTMCTTIFSGSGVITGGAGVYNNSWRNWTNR